MRFTAVKKPPLTDYALHIKDSEGSEDPLVIPHPNFPFLFLAACTLMALPAACRSVQSPGGIAVVESGAGQITNVWWTPEPGQAFQVQYEGELDLSVEVDIISLDLFETSVEDIAGLHLRGIKVLCYLNAGAWEKWRPDQADFPESVLGFHYRGWPGERWLDIRQLEVLQPILTSRLDLCLAKGFDGVEPDNLDGYDNKTGFAITPEDQLNFNRWLARTAHERGLGIGLKNNPDQAQLLIDSFDWITTENCFKEQWCEQVSIFVQAGKPVFAIEYREEGMERDDFCHQAARLGMDAILKNESLDAWLAACP